MLRTFFLAIGVALVLIGFEALVLDHAVLANDSPIGRTIVEKSEPMFDDYGFEVGRKVLAPSKKTITPPEWAPWSMLSSGAIVLVYSIAMRSRRRQNADEGE